MLALLLVLSLTAPAHAQTPDRHDDFGQPMTAREAAIVKSLQHSKTEFQILSFRGFWAACIEPNLMGSPLNQFAFRLLALNETQTCFSPDYLDAMREDAFYDDDAQALALNESALIKPATESTLREVLKVVERNKAAREADPLLDVQFSRLNQMSPDARAKNFKAEEIAGDALTLRFLRERLQHSAKLITQQRDELLNKIHKTALLGSVNSQSLATLLRLFESKATQNPESIMIEPSLGPMGAPEVTVFTDVIDPRTHAAFRAMIRLQESRAMEEMVLLLEARFHHDLKAIKSAQNKILQMARSRAERLEAIAWRTASQFSAAERHVEAERSHLLAGSKPSDDFLAAVAEPRKTMMEEERAWRDGAASPSLLMASHPGSRAECPLQSAVRAVFQTKTPP